MESTLQSLDWVVLSLYFAALFAAELNIDISVIPNGNMPGPPDTVSNDNRLETLRKFYTGIYPLAFRSSSTCCSLAAFFTAWVIITADGCPYKKEKEKVVVCSHDLMFIEVLLFQNKK